MGAAAFEEAPRQNERKVVLENVAGNDRTSAATCNIATVWMPRLPDYTQYQIEAKRSGFDLERRIKGAGG